MVRLTRRTLSWARRLRFLAVPRQRQSPFAKLQRSRSGLVAQFLAPPEGNGSLLGNDAAVAQTEPDVLQRTGRITDDRPDGLCQFHEITIVDENFPCIFKRAHHC
jgi:hypothetical protein